MEAFKSLGIDIRLIKALDAFGFVAPSEVQKQAIPALMQGRDLIMQSETGTGKTFAYLLPIFSKILASEARLKSLDWPSALIICPTQELSVQVARQAALLAHAASVPIKSLTLLGGTHFSRQKEELKIHPHIITGTPGRLADLVRMRYFSMSFVEFLVLDEADRLFSKEYIEPVEFLLSKTPASSIRVLASATIPEKTRKKASAWMHNPAVVDLSGEGILTDAIEHWVFYAEHRKKIDLLKRIITAVRPQRCLIFAADTYRVQRTTERLQESGLKCRSILSRMEKQSRYSAIDQFRKGSIAFMVTTDLGARGLDIQDISHVISLDLPEDPNVYVHRAGRTGRAGKKGISILVADSLELERASRTALKYGFVFRTKWLESGHVIEPTVEEFFERVRIMEEERSRQSRP